MSFEPEIKIEFGATVFVAIDYRSIRTKDFIDFLFNRKLLLSCFLFKQKSFWLSFNYYKNEGGTKKKLIFKYLLKKMHVFMTFNHLVCLNNFVYCRYLDIFYLFVDYQKKNYV